MARPAQDHSPTHKAKVDLGVKLVQRLVRLALRDRPLAGLENINGLLRGIIARLDNRPLRRAPGTTRKTLLEALDRLALCGLPAEPRDLRDASPTSGRVRLPPDARSLPLFGSAPADRS